MWQRFSEAARRAVFYAQEEAQAHSEGYVSTEHFLLGLCREEGTTADLVFVQMGVSRDRIVDETRKQMPRGEPRPSQDMTLTPRAKRVVDLAFDEAKDLKDQFIGTEHILLGLIHESEGLAGRVLAKVGVELVAARRAVVQVRETRGNPVGSEDDTVAAKKPRVETPAPLAWGTVLRRELYRPEFLCLLLFSEPGVEEFLKRAGVDGGKLRTELEIGIVGRSVHLSQVMGQDLNSLETEGIANSLAFAQEECKRAGQPFHPAHLLIGIVREDKNAFAKMVHDEGITLEDLRNALNV